MQYQNNFLPALKCGQRRRDQETKTDKRADRIARQGEYELSVGKRGEESGAARLDRQLVKVDRRADLLEDIGNEVERAHRNPARNANHIAIGGRKDGLSNRKPLIFDRLLKDGLTMHCSDQRFQNVLIAVSNLCAVRPDSHLDKFISGHHDSNPWLFVHRNLGSPCRRANSHVDRSQQIPGRQDNVACPFVGSAWGYRLPSLDGLQNFHCLAVGCQLRSFHSYDSVRPFRNRRAGIDLHGLTLTDWRLGHDPGRDLPHHLQCYGRIRGIDGPDCISIHKRAIERRLINVRRNRLCQRPK